MPIYSYKCPKCEIEFCSHWRVKDYRKPTPCPECNTIADKQINRDFVFFSNDKGGFVAGYNPALGQEVSTRGEYKRILKEKGLIELGNEKNSNHKHQSKRKGVSDKILKQASEMGAEFTGNEAVALKNGEKLHKD